MKILISGGGIAGLAAALLLKKQNHDITLIDKAPAFQKLGYGLSLKGFGIELIDQLGLLRELKKYELPISTFEISNSNGKPIRDISKETLDIITGGAIPIARADLHGVLYDATQREVPIKFATTITAIEHKPEAEHVTFSNGKTEVFDLVVSAEGIHSSTRKLLWGDKGWTPFDITYSAAIINQEHGFKLGHAYSYRGVGKTIAFFPITPNKVAIQAYFRGIDKSVNERIHAKTLLLDTFKDFAPHVVKLLNAISEDDFIFYDSIAMIELPSLSEQRVVMLGDAAYCPTFLSGMGASLSLLGAKTLSDALQTSTDVPKALAQYNNIMKPLAEHFQANARSNMFRELPTNALRATLVNTIMRVMPISMLTKSVSKQIAIEQQLLAPARASSPQYKR